MIKENDVSVSPAMTEPKAHVAFHCLTMGRALPLTLIVGSNWVTATDLNVYTVNADEPATRDQVEAMLIEAGGISEWWET